MLHDLSTMIKGQPLLLSLLGKAKRKTFKLTLLDAGAWVTHYYLKTTNDVLHTNSCTSKTVCLSVPWLLQAIFNIHPTSYGFILAFISKGHRWLCHMWGLMPHSDYKQLVVRVSLSTTGCVTWLFHLFSGKKNTDINKQQHVKYAAVTVSTWKSQVQQT